MSMTKADFQEIADAIAEAKRMIGWTDIPELATACARQYKGGYGFNRQRFVDACGFPEA